MNLLNRFNVHESSEFHKKGYFILKNSFDQSEIKRAQNSFFEIKRNAKKGSYPFIRVYDDYSALRNLSGIEMTFNEQILSQEIFNFIEKSKLLEITKNIIGDNLELELSRYHVTENFTHVGNWHRDNKISSEIDTIQVNLYLFDEKGMQILDKSHIKEVEDEQEIKRTPHLSLKKSKWIETKAGDLLFFNPSLLHRGISLKPRANIHFRFRKLKQNQKLISVNYKNVKLSDSWLKLLENSPHALNDKDLKTYNFKSDLKSIFKRLLRRIIYNLIFFLPLNSPLYYRFNVWPNLNIRKFFKLKT